MRLFQKNSSSSLVHYMLFGCFYILPMYMYYGHSLIWSSLPSRLSLGGQGNFCSLLSPASYSLENFTLSFIFCSLCCLIFCSVLHRTVKTRTCALTAFITKCVVSLQTLCPKMNVSGFLPFRVHLERLEPLDCLAREASSGSLDWGENLVLQVQQDQRLNVFYNINISY